MTTTIHVDVATARLPLSFPFRDPPSHASRWLYRVALSLLLSVPFLARGEPAPATSACAFTGATVDGSCVSAANGQQLGPDGNGFRWSVDGRTCDKLSPANCNYIVYSGSYAFFDKAVRAVWHKPQGAFFETNFVNCGRAWRYWTGSAREFAKAPGEPLALPERQFFNETTATAYRSVDALIGAARSGQTIAIGKPPPGLDCWPIAFNLGQNDVTLKLGPGVALGGTSTSLGLIVLSGANQRLLGDAAARAALWGELRVAGAKNPTIKHLHLSKTCETFAGTATCVLTSDGGTVTISDVIAEDCGSYGNGGQDHCFYLSASVGGDPNTNVQLDHIVARNVHGGGWLIKLRPGGQAAPSNVSNVSAGCTVASHACETNGVVDLPCGGNYNFRHFSFERGPAGDNWYMVRVGEEIPAGFSGCTKTPGVPPYASNVVTFDSGWFVWDGPCPGSRKPGTAILVCAGGADCTVPGFAPTITVKNSKIVSDPQGCSFANSLGPGVIDGGGNVFYASRAEAGLPPFPYQPPPL